MKKVFLVALLGIVCAAPAVAKQFELPADNPAVKIMFPDSWAPEAIDTGAQGVSPSGVLVFAETATLKSVEGLVTDNFEFLKTQGVTIDPKSEKDSDKTVNGLPMSLIEFTGKDKEGPTHVTMVIVTLKDNLGLVLTSWGSPEAEQADDKDFGIILNSIKKM